MERPPNGSPEGRPHELRGMLRTAVCVLLILVVLAAVAFAGLLFYTWIGLQHATRPKDYDKVIANPKDRAVALFREAWIRNETLVDSAEDVHLYVVPTRGPDVWYAFRLPSEKIAILLEELKGRGHAPGSVPASVRTHIPFTVKRWWYKGKLPTQGFVKLRYADVYEYVIVNDADGSVYGAVAITSPEEQRGPNTMKRGPLGGGSFVIDPSSPKRKVADVDLPQVVDLLRSKDTNGNGLWPRRL